ncbi:MAG TPA: hypothetical protein PLA61_14365, partial [Ferruginibacter sp.]|nr:hypothetical protein [Ferruginibacter sp.]
DVTWVRSRETHPGPHSAWFWDGRLTGGGAIIDLGCHCIEIIRNSPRWQPAIQNGKKVNAYHRQPITFVVSE